MERVEAARRCEPEPAVGGGRAPDRARRERRERGFGLDACAVEVEDARVRRPDPEATARVVCVEADDLAPARILIRARPDERAATGAVEALKPAPERRDVDRVAEARDVAHAPAQRRLRRLLRRRLRLAFVSDSGLLTFDSALLIFDNALLKILPAASVFSADIFSAELTRRPFLLDAPARFRRALRSRARAALDIIDDGPACRLVRCVLALDDLLLRRELHGLSLRPPFRLQADVEARARADEQKAAAVFCERVDGLALDLLDLAPRARRFVAREQTAVRADEQAAPRRSVERAHEVSLSLRRELLDANAARVVPADAARRAEPSDALSVNEDCVHRVRAKAPRRAREREVLDQLPRAVSEDAVPFGRRVHVAARVRRERVHRAGRRARQLRGARESSVVNLENSAVARGSLRAEEERAVRGLRQRLDVERARASHHFLRLAPRLDCQKAPTARADDNHLAQRRETRQLKRLSLARRRVQTLAHLSDFDCAAICRFRKPTFSLSSAAEGSRLRAMRNAARTSACCSGPATRHTRSAKALACCRTKSLLRRVSACVGTVLTDRASHVTFSSGASNTALAEMMGSGPAWEVEPSADAVVSLSNDSAAAAIAPRPASTSDRSSPRTTRPARDAPAAWLPSARAVNGAARRPSSRPDESAVASRAALD